LVIDTERDAMPPTRRRTVLGALATLLVAGCSSPGGGTETGEGGTVTGDLDLREANVVGVAYRTDGGEYEFDVTLHHDDEGEDGYADWWQIERLDGTQLARRDLAHPHATQPFTRSTRVSVPEDVSCVVVRGHDRTHGYGGVAMVVNLDSGRITERRQGSEKASVSASDCP
jgi:hypothetical protein